MVLTRSMSGATPHPKSGRVRQRTGTENTGDSSDTDRLKNARPKNRRLRSESADQDFDYIPPARELVAEGPIVPDITISFLYNPHRLIMLASVWILLIYLAFGYDSDQYTPLHNLRVGVGSAIAIFLCVGGMVFPSGPFIRPHPVVWRIVFGCAVIYQAFGLCLLVQSTDSARKSLRLLDSTLGVELTSDKSYAEDCTLSLETFFSPAVWDRFALAHFLGWMVKAFMLRNRVYCWVISIMWEMIELSLIYMQPNFAECWWDSLIMDVLLCNGIGIEVGIQLVRLFEMREFAWSGVFSIPTVRGKVKRALLQFSPESWQHLEWEGTHSIKRWLGAIFVILMLQCIELSGFLLKTTFWLPIECDLNLYRLFVMALCCAPAVKQFYIYLVDDERKTMGAHCWMCLTCVVTEWLIIIKHSKGMFPPPPTQSIVMWLGVAGFFLFVSFWFLTKLPKRRNQRNKRRSEKSA